MSFPVNLYQFSKAANSTVRPGNPSVTYNCVLKDECGIMSPVIGLDLGLTNDPSAYNYAYVPAFNRYYYVSEWQWSNRLWWAYLEEDTLATWKSYIGSESFYILRAANAYDGTITDDMYPTFPQPDIINVQGSARPWTPDLDKGYYVVGMINNSSNAMGAVGYYVFNNAQFRTLCNKLMANTDWLSVPKDVLDGGIDDNLLKTLFNPFQYVVSCLWFPFTPPFGEALTDLPYGWWTLNGVECNRLGSSSIYATEVDFPLSRHPQAESRGSYLNSGPFTELSLTMEPFGTITLDPSDFIGDSNVVTVTIVDCVSGIGLLQICKPTSSTLQAPANIIDTRMGQFGVPVQLAQIGVDRLTQAETVVTGTANVARDTLHTAAQATNISNLLNPLAGELEAAASGAQTVATATSAVADGIRASIPQMQTTGSNGSIAAYYNIPLLHQSFYKLVNEDLADTGRPYCKVATPSSIGGYMVARNANITFPGTINEISAVKAYLESGFYYL